MITEYIKRGQKMGFDEKGVLVYKIPVTEKSPELEEDEEDELPLLDL